MPLLGVAASPAATASTWSGCKRCNSSLYLEEESSTYSCCHSKAAMTALVWLLASGSSCMLTRLSNL
eukprot:357716-Chlamydomonas_euryale.AAC.3